MGDFHRHAQSLWGRDTQLFCSPYTKTEGECNAVSSCALRAALLWGTLLEVSGWRCCWFFALVCAATCDAPAALLQSRWEEKQRSVPFKQLEIYSEWQWQGSLGQPGVAFVVFFYLLMHKELQRWTCTIRDCFWHRSVLEGFKQSHSRNLNEPPMYKGIANNLEASSVYIEFNTFSPNLAIPVMVCSCQESLGFRGS